MSGFKYFSEEEERRFNEITRQKAINDELALIAEGRAEGIAERDAEVLANLKGMGYSDEVINKILAKHS